MWRQIKKLETTKVYSEKKGLHIHYMPTGNQAHGQWHLNVAACPYCWAIVAVMHLFSIFDPFYKPQDTILCLSHILALMLPPSFPPSFTPHHHFFLAPRTSSQPMLCRPWHVQYNRAVVPSLFWNCWWTPLSHTSADRIYCHSFAFSNLSSSLLPSLCLPPIFPHPI